MIKSAFAAALAALAFAGPAFAEEKLPSPLNVLQWTQAEKEIGFRRAEDIAPTHLIAHGPNVCALPKANHEIAPLITIGGKTMSVDAYMAAFKASGLLVLKNGEIVLERYGLNRTPEEKWTSFSMAKSITSALIGAAVKDGAIRSIDDPVTAYVKELKGSAYEGVTIRQVMTMTSGVDWNEDYADPASDVAREGFVTFPGENPVLGYMRRLKRAVPAGSRFHYNTGETDLAGFVVSGATGKTLAAYASEKIFKPFGMEGDGVWALDLGGHERAGCCVSMRLRDYGRLGLFMLDNGAGQLPAGWTAEATKRQVPFGADDGYGYFWWIEKDSYSARGIFGQMIEIVPAEKLVIVVNSAWPAAGSDDLYAARSALIAAVRAAAK